MTDLESTIHWRQYSVGIVLALYIALFALTQFDLFRITFATGLGCAVLFLSLSWDIYVMKLTRDREKVGKNGTIADGLLMAGLMLVFLGAFF